MVLTWIRTPAADSLAWQQMNIYDFVPTGGN